MGEDHGGRPGLTHFVRARLQRTSDGLSATLTGPQGSADWKSVVERMTLEDGEWLVERLELLSGTNSQPSE